MAAAFDGGRLSSDGGLLLLRDMEKRCSLIHRLASCLVDKRSGGRVVHTLKDLLTSRIFGICCGYEDCNDFDALRNDPMFQVAMDRSPVRGGCLASQPTLSRLENSVGARELYRLGEALVDHFVESHRDEAVTRILLDLDGTDDPCHGQQEFEFFNGHYDSHCYLPLLAFATVETAGGSRSEQELVCALLRPGNAAPGRHALSLLKRLVKRLSAAFPKAQIVFRADSGFPSEATYRFLEEAGAAYVVAMPSNTRLLSLSQAFMDAAHKEKEHTGQAACVFGEVSYRAARWKTHRRTVVKAEVLFDKDNPRFVVTNLALPPEDLYRFYTQRGDVENRIKELKDDLFSGRTSCHRFLANQFRLLLHAAALVLIQALRKRLCGTAFERVQAGNLRSKLLKVAARVEETTRRIVIHLPTSYPWQSLFRRLLVPCMLAQT